MAIKATKLGKHYFAIKSISGSLPNTDRTSLPMGHQISRIRKKVLKMCVYTLILADLGGHLKYLMHFFVEEFAKLYFYMYSILGVGKRYL